MPDSPTPPPSDRADEIVLGVDYGTKRIGLALGFADSGLVVPLPTIDHPGSEAGAAAALLDVARARDARRVVLGHPIHMSGDASPMSQAAARVAEAVRAAGEVEVELQDERLSSAAAEAQLSAAGLRWWQYDKGTVDAVAALTIVRDHLHRRYPDLAQGSAPPPEAPEPAGGERSRRRDRRRRAQKGRRKRGRK